MEAFSDLSSRVNVAVFLSGQQRVPRRAVCKKTTPLTPKHSRGWASLFIEPMECRWSINGQRDIVATFVGHAEAERLQRIDLLAHSIGVFVRHLSPLCHGRQVA